jgi:hypothetical protein
LLPYLSCGWWLLAGLWVLCYHPYLHHYHHTYLYILTAFASWWALKRTFSVNRGDNGRWAPRERGTRNGAYFFTALLTFRARRYALPRGDIAFSAVLAFVFIARFRMNDMRTGLLPVGIYAFFLDALVQRWLRPH